MTADFVSFPPEINSGLIFGGAGPEAFVVAANSWESLAAELRGSASSFESAVSILAHDGWSGPSSEAMLAAAVPYVEWLYLTAAQAEGAAAKVLSGVAAFESAQASSVHPALVIANRMQLASLVATNLLGQNSPAIAAVESEYAEMWSQDVAAMLGYQAQAAVIGTVTPFEAPPSLANTATDLLPLIRSESAATVTAASQSASSVQDVTLPSLQDVLTPAVSAAQTLASPVGALMSPAMMVLSSGMQFGMQGVTGLAGGALAPEANLAGAVLDSEARLATPAGYAGSAASAALGEARLAGSLSVPASWAASAAGINPTTASAIPNLTAMTGEAQFAQQGAASGAGMPMLPTAPGNAGATTPTRAMGGAINLYTKSRPSVLPRTGI